MGYLQDQGLPCGKFLGHLLHQMGGTGQAHTGQRADEVNRMQRTFGHATHAHGQAVNQALERTLGIHGEQGDMVLPEVFHHIGPLGSSHCISSGVEWAGATDSPRPLRSDNSTVLNCLCSWRMP